MSSRPPSVDVMAESKSDSVVGSDSRLPYALLLLVFVASRVLYYLLGVRFDARGVSRFFQVINPELLKHRLLESMYYLHVQPPGFNLYTGGVLKLFPNHYAIAFHALHLIYGAVICCLRISSPTISRHRAKNPRLAESSEKTHECRPCFGGPEEP
jgi:hypothetical protein